MSQDAIGSLAHLSDGDEVEEQGTEPVVGAILVVPPEARLVPIARLQRVDMAWASKRAGRSPVTCVGHACFDVDLSEGEGGGVSLSNATTWLQT